MKTLNQITERTDYKKATAALRQSVIEIAIIVCQKMLDLDFDVRGEGINVNGSFYGIKKRKSSGFEESYLYAESGALDVNKSFYFAGNFNCFVERASNDDVVKFANDLPDILRILDETETELTSKATDTKFWNFYKGWQESKEQEVQVSDTTEAK